MGYTTEFSGSLSFDKPITNDHKNYINQFSETRRMKRDPDLVGPDPLREAVGLSLGTDAEFFVGGTGFCGQDKDKSIIEYNCPPENQPGLWCKWAIEAGSLQWNGNEKFYNYVEWLQYLIDNFFKPWGYLLNGNIKWRGEEVHDSGNIIVNDNVILVQKYE
jgi:hypothetical protein